MQLRASIESTLLAFSLLATLGVGALVAAWHAPRQNRELRLAAPSGRQQIWHFLSPDCDCSRRLAARLRQRPPLPGWHERLAWRNPDGGWSAQSLDGQPVPDPVPASGIRSVPWLLVLNHDAKPVYAGGYGMRSSAGEEVLSAIARGESLSPLPVRGCTYSAESSKGKP